MEKTLQDHLLRALNELESNSFKSYQNKLTDCRIKEGYERIPRGKLENKDREDLVKLIFQYYGDSYGPELTVGVLKAINENNVAADLQKLLGKESSASASRPKIHFVDQHREALIKGVALVDPILDSLMSANLLTYEDYSTIRREGTSYAQMRMLFYKYVCSWEEPQKDLLRPVPRTRRAYAEFVIALYNDSLCKLLNSLHLDFLVEAFCRETQNRFLS
ncbi:PREDICTED: apoptosis-associated speck-like protein containing a CARD [Nanorana parkeri]|uniref:apoptosis-associated speck-like protein containing a CARD n=1 Tax=Nanorana parkeri TaxID=125878 RepID=UPI000853FB27|nr:PREDICTED: apoptosis-associated speck-like protein containing a CARD [Nanorana parkeri]